MTSKDTSIECRTHVDANRLVARTREVGDGTVTPDDARTQFAGLPFMALTPDAATDWLIGRALAGGRGDVHYINAYSIALTGTDPAMLACFSNATANFADGRPISILSRYLASAKIDQVRGPQAFETIMDRGREHGLRHFLLGSTPETLEQLRSNLERRYPGVQIVGVESPPFRALTETEQAEQDERLRAVSPHIIWVGLGTPKQDFEAQRLARHGFLTAAVGAAFDFSAGTKREAPEWLRRYSLEWLFRFVTEPKRLWRRYLFGNVEFLKLAWRRR